MYAIIVTGGKQYRVEKGQAFKFEKLPGEAGANVNFDKVLMLGGSGKPKIGAPYIDDASVEAKVLKQDRTKKIIVFKKKKRKGYKKARGHRQSFTEVEITKIVNG